MNKIIITVRHGQVSTVHAQEHLEVAIIDEDKPRDGDAAHVAGLKYETQSMLRVYPHQRKRPPNRK